LRAREPVGRRQAKWPGLRSQYLKLLTLHGPVVRVWAGPIFTFPDDMPADVRTVSINETNGHLLRGGFDDWLADIGYRQPFRAVVEDNRAVSICASVRITDAVHEAGGGNTRRAPATRLCRLRRSRLGTYRAIPRGDPFLQYVLGKRSVPARSSPTSSCPDRG
jgi:hypothetical protein